MMKFQVCTVFVILVTGVCTTYTGSSPLEDRSFNLDSNKEICNSGRVTLRFSTNQTSVNELGVFNIPVPEMVVLQSMGNLSIDQGSCSINFQLPATQKCNSICVSVNRLQVAMDQAEVKFSPMLSMSQGMNCTTARTLNLMITQTSQYTTQVRAGNMGNTYQLDIVVQAVCPGNNPDLVMQSNQDTYMSPVETLDNLIHGVVTGVMLALGWLIIFAIFKFYYKYSGNGGKRYYIPPPEDQETNDDIQMVNMQQTSKSGASSSKT